MNEPRQITTFQTAAIVINSTIGISLLALPRIASEKTGTGSLIVVLMAILYLLISVLILANLSRRFPGENFLTYSKLLVGKHISRVMLFFFICIFFINTSIVLREFGEVMRTTLMQETPISVTLLFMLYVIAMSARNNITTISFMHTYYLPFIIGPLIILVIIAYRDIEWIHVKPLLGNDTTFMDFLSGSVTIFGLPFIQIGMFIIVIIAPHMLKPSKSLKGALWGAVISGMMIVLATFITLAVFGAEEMKKSLWPVLVLTRMTELPSSILERLDIVFLVVWIISAFTTLLSGYLITIELSSQLFNFRSHRSIALLAIPVVYVLSIIPKNIIHLSEIMVNFAKWSIVLTVGYPLFLSLIALWRKKGDDVRE
ncbi:GerAB/ArcD/ProY family transporter [Metabacillus malikii]|uniref:Spore germination protein n=1 Tax=Metabacillus malikii TaxID=1504265 RepID=A0ABT9ZMH8_9BACI|nr:endospore germination permease [Metabacillus malikii]MDQ0233459.1 spore germination protein [Metabacillus malikii]